MSLLNRFQPFRSSIIRRERESTEKRRIILQQALLERYRIVPGVTGARGCVSFECFSEPRFFLCHRKNRLIIERYKDSIDYKNEATFVILENMWFHGYFAFECLTDPGWFIRRTESGLTLQRFDGKEDFKQCASFKLSRKKCLSCNTAVTQGARVWIRVNNMCFDRGVVTKDGNVLHVVTTKGKLIECDRKRPEFLSLDKIPNPHDIRRGTRVVAQWHDRMEPYYIATVQGNVGRKYILLFDDDDEEVCELKNIRMLLWTETTEEDNIEHPPWSSLEGIPRLRSGMLVDSEKQEKSVVKRSQLWKNSRKISMSDQHLDLRNRQENTRDPLCKSMSCRETNKILSYWNPFTQTNRSISGTSLAGNGRGRCRRARQDETTALPIFDEFSSCP